MARWWPGRKQRNAQNDLPHSLLASRSKSPYFLSASNGSCMVWGQGNRLWNFIRHDFFFFKQKYKASCQQPLPLGNPVLNHSIPEQRCLHRRNLTPLSPGSNAVPSGCMGGRERGSLVAGNQILGEQGCWVVRAATFSSLIPGAPSPILAPDSCQLASLLLSPWAVDISNCTEKQRLRERKQGRQSQSLAQDPTPLPCVLEYRHLSCDI